MNLMCTNIIQ